MIICTGQHAQSIFINVFDFRDSYAIKQYYYITDFVLLSFNHSIPCPRICTAVYRQVDVNNKSLSPINGHTISQVPDEYNCTICLQPIQQPIDTPCGHTFCAACIEPCIKIKKLCPNCRKSLLFSDLRPSTFLVRNILNKLMVCVNVSNNRRKQWYTLCLSLFCQDRCYFFAQTCEL